MKYYYWLIICAITLLIGFCKGTKRAEFSIAQTGHGGYFYSSDQIIGQTSVIGEIEITENSIWGDYTDIERTVKFLGDNWRIPTINELKYIDMHRRSITSKLENNCYWSSNPNPKNNRENLQYDFKDSHIQSALRCDADTLNILTEYSGAMKQFALLVRDIE